MPRMVIWDILHRPTFKRQDWEVQPWYLTIGAIAFAGFFVVKSMLAKQRANV